MHRLLACNGHKLEKALRLVSQSEDMRSDRSHHSLYQERQKDNARPPCHESIVDLSLAFTLGANGCPDGLPYSKRAFDHDPKDGLQPSATRANVSKYRTANWEQCRRAQGFRDSRRYSPSPPHKKGRLVNYGWGPEPNCTCLQTPVLIVPEGRRATHALTAAV